jgi:hypothetical protein
MKIKGSFPLFIIVALAWVVIISSCANQGMPEGGPKDSIPPLLLNMKPNYKALNYHGDDVSLTFNEYLNTDAISEALVVSPPLKKRPTVLTKSKTLIIRFNEDLKDSATYSLDFKNTIVDNNESNPFTNFRFSFSTGPVYDSLRVAGRVIDAFNLEPNEGILVLLQSNLNDTAVSCCIPDYIAKTDEEGLFMIDNIAPGTYNLFAVNDVNNDLKYNKGAEEIAFVDSFVVPDAYFVEVPDTLVKGVDSMLILGHTYFTPDPFFMRYFMEDVYSQYPKTQSRITPQQCVFSFNEPITDSFSVKLLDTVVDNWQMFELYEKKDSMLMWITDTALASNDSLNMEISYCLLDSAGMPYTKHDTVMMAYVDQSQEKDKKRKKQGGGLFGGKSDKKPENKPNGRPGMNSPGNLSDKTAPNGGLKDLEGKIADTVPAPPIPQFDWQSELKEAMDLNSEIRFTSPKPIEHFDKTMCKLYLKEDTLKTPLNITIEDDKDAFRTYMISYKWEPATEYCFDIDSAACTNIYGVTSRKYHKEFTTRDESYYASMEFKMSNVVSPIIMQVLKNNENEDVIREDSLFADGSILFDYLIPDKYKVKVIFDDNGNGKWDCGSLQDKKQAERVAYVPYVIKLRPNFSEEYTWKLKNDPTYTKNVVDKEVEAQKRKEAEEKARKEAESNKKNQYI